MLGFAYNSRNITRILSSILLRTLFAEKDIYLMRQIAEMGMVSPYTRIAISKRYVNR